jgi:hypothetical protein
MGSKTRLLEAVVESWPVTVVVECDVADESGRTDPYAFLPQ